MTYPLSQGHETVEGKPRIVRPAADNSSGWPAGSIFSDTCDLSRFLMSVEGLAEFYSGSVNPACSSFGQPASPCSVPQILTWIPISRNMAAFVARARLAPAASGP